ncbi:hypothetical protein GLOIN_2v1537121 [Rhizophagus clarus]|uniref:Peroxisomal membrane protein PEX14-like KPWE domain-containing protein n=1 Tax=Rhizophagus clarus TaxID=94130 RepID=A0A8H3M8E6_9GLOM|nr:hypothetical protein GLOIN_2v1537121 [Rhizophagus clarus]
MTEQIFEAFENYDFENDTKFQYFKKAKYFYYSKIIQEFDYDNYLTWKMNTNKSVSSNIENNTVLSSTMISQETLVRDINNNPQSEQTKDNPQYPRTFHQLVEMISKEQPIPGIKQIPNELNKGTPSIPTIKPRPKPWEKKI